MKSFHTVTAALVCVALLLGHALVSWSAIQTKSPTYDEPYHAVSAWVQWNLHDFRMDNEDPPLWMYWASIPNGRDALHADLTGYFWTSMPREAIHQWYWGVVTLFRTPGNDADALINRCRLMMLVPALLLGGVIAAWAWRLGGPVAAISATLLFSLDPNFLAHSALMKNDAVFALSLTLLACGLWRVGLGATVKGILLLAILCVFALGVKFSGLVAVMLVPAVLGVRALLPWPWVIIGTEMQTRLRRLLAAAAITLLCAVVSYTGIWAMYGFRFRPSPDKNVWLNIQAQAQSATDNHTAAEYDGYPPVDAVRKPNLVIKAAVFADRHGLLPQAYICGFLFTYANALYRWSYALGMTSPVGWWWYFPFAISVKSPITTLLLGAVIALLAVPVFRRSAHWPRRWAVLGLAIPFAVFFASAITSHLNIGIRHVLGLYPFVFVGAGWLISSCWKNARLRYTSLGLIALLAVETVAAYPNYIPYFNFPSEWTAGGFHLLGDSNLDWGQDLPLLHDWQRANPDKKLYLCYFGYDEPHYYGIHYTPLPGGYHYDSKPSFPDPYARCVVAVSTTYLQGLYVPDRILHDFFDNWRKRPPLAVLGKSIYLYEYDPGQELLKK